MSYLLYISTANPRYRHQQEKFIDFYANAVDEGDIQTQRKIKIVNAKSGIHTRYSVIPDFSLPVNEFQFFSKNSSLLPEIGLNQRMDLFKQEAIELSVQAVLDIPNFETLKQEVTHIITVTCTGLFAPGLDIELMKRLSLSNDTVRTSINFMGCNAAILALKQAHSICESNPSANVLVVCTELCTIHFQRIFTDDYIVSNNLFSDGSAAAIVSGSNLEISDSFRPIKIKDFKSLVAHEGSSDMAWQITETGFVMNLTSYVSSIISNNLPLLFSSKQSNPIDKWLIHPGGKRILDECATSFNLQRTDLNESYETLENYGNMSSPTILFVLKNYIENNFDPSYKNICALGFGPGLSIESVNFENV
jgi:predicted naringenin-chalcone synthase